MLLVAGPLAALLLLDIAGDVDIATGPASKAYDNALADSAIAISTHLSVRDGRIGLDLPPQAVAILRADRRDSVYFLVTGPHGEYVAGDRDVPAFPPPAEDNPVFHDARIQDRDLRLVVYRAPTAAGDVTVQVAETTFKRQRVTQRAFGSLVLPNLITIGVAMALVYFGVRAGTEPLLRLSREIEARSPRDLGPIATGSLPEELKPLALALNRLFDLLRVSAESQQRFLANAAHQLRTPLAGLQAQIEVAVQAPAPPEVADRLRQLLASTQRIGHLTHQLLAIARTAPEAAMAHEMRPVNLRELVENGASGFLDQAVAKQIDFGIEAADAPVRGVEWLLREVLANLVDNAIAYTPAGGRVTARCGAGDAAAWLEVEDNGPGIPPEERERIFDRFYRMPKSPGEGCGLGLAIVKEIADLHGARIVVCEPEQGSGTRMRMKFPEPSARMDAR